jgi:hypothetical protein
MLRPESASSHNAGVREPQDDAFITPKQRSITAEWHADRRSRPIDHGAAMTNRPAAES